MLNRLARNIEESGLIKREDRVLVAISGGPDSVFLANALFRLGYKIGLAHVNYQMRGETSEYEEQMVRKMGEEWEIEVYVKVCNSGKEKQKSGQSFQMLAREQRYQFFDSILETANFDICATAHHQDDQVESLLISLIKGEQSHIFKGIPAKRGPYVRPLLFLTKQEIRQTLDDWSIPYSIDISNLTNDYLRNRFRNEIIPLLKSINPSLSSQMIEQYKWYQKQRRLTNKLLDDYLISHATVTAEATDLDWTAFEQLYGRDSLPLLLERMLEKMGWKGGILQHALKLCDSQSGKVVISQNGELSRTRTGVSYYPETQEENPNSIVSIDNIDTSLKFEMGADKIQISLLTDKDDIKFERENEFYLDKDAIAFPITIRRWKKGDRMKPFGMRNFKKLSDIFIDAKLSTLEKQRAIVFEDQNAIFCLSGFRISDDVKIGPKSNKILKIKIVSS